MSVRGGGDIHLFKLGAIQRGYAGLTTLSKQRVVVDWGEGESGRVLGFLLEEGGCMEVDEEETVGPMPHH